MLRLNICIFILLTAALVSAEYSSTNPPPEIRVAVIAPTTGDLANYGTEIAQGAQLAVDQLQEPSSPIRLFFEDACLPAETVRAAHKLVNVDQIQSIVGSYCVLGMIPMMTITEKKHVIVFHSSAVADVILDTGDFTFTTNVAIRDEAKALAQYAYHRIGARQAAVLYLLVQWGQDYQRYFVEEFKKLGGKVVSSSEHSIEANDFQAELTKIKASEPDVIFVANVGSQLGTTLKQAKLLGLNQPILAAHEAEEQSVLEIGGVGAEGLRFLSPALPHFDAAVSRFQKAYRVKYGGEPGVLAANAFDATNIVVKFLRECEHSTECAKEKIYNLKNYPGMSGLFSMTPEGGTTKEFVRKVVKLGKYERLE